MKFLFVYYYKGEKNNTEVQSTGSIEISTEATDKITSELIEGTVKYVTEFLEREYKGLKIDTLVPAGWFKFDE